MKVSSRELHLSGERSPIEISVILPTYNRPGPLRNCLDALARLQHTKFEIIIVDDGSSPPVSSLIKEYSDRLILTYLYQENAGPACARNFGAQAARGSILAFTDDDCAPNPDWLKHLSGVLARTPDVLVGGVTVNALACNIHSEVSQDLISFLYEYAQMPNKGFDFFTTNNMACQRHIFLDLGGFDETFPLAAAEDRDFGLRWARTGGFMAYTCKAVVEHYHELDLKKFWRLHSNYGRGARHLHKRFKQHQQQPVKFAGLKFYTLMLSYPFRKKLSRPYLRFVLLFLSQVAMVSGYARDLLKQH